jgi:hypothetical protein
MAQTQIIILGGGISATAPFTVNAIPFIVTASPPSISATTAAFWTTGAGGTHPAVIINPAAGADPQPAANEPLRIVGGLISEAAGSPDSTVIGRGAIAGSNQQIVIGQGANGGGSNGTVAIGTLASAGNVNSMAIGFQASAANNSTTAVGSSANAQFSGDTSFGSAANARGSSSTAIGSGANATGNSSCAIGANSSASQLANTGVGTNAVCTGQRATAVGGLATSSGDWSIAIGNNARASQTNSIAIGGYDNTAGGAMEADAVRSIGIGWKCNINGAHTDSFILGGGANSFAANTAVFGGPLLELHTAVFGRGDTHTASIGGFLIRCTDGVTTNNLNMGALTIQAPRSTGNAAGSAINLNTSIPGGSGNALQATRTSVAAQVSGTANDTDLLVWDVNNALLARVSVGAANSGGAGFKLLRIPN